MEGREGEGRGGGGRGEEGRERERKQEGKGGEKEGRKEQLGGPFLIELHLVWLTIIKKSLHYVNLSI